MIATSPASDALRHIETSGLPFLSTQVNIIVTTVATAGAIVVVRNIICEVINVGGCGAVESVPTEPEDEYTECAERDRVT